MAGFSSWGHKELDMIECACTHTHTHTCARTIYPYFGIKCFPGSSNYTDALGLHNVYPVTFVALDTSIMNPNTDTPTANTHVMYILPGGLETNLTIDDKYVQSCLTLHSPMDYTVHGILQARILEWVAFPFSMGSS